MPEKPRSHGRAIREAPFAVRIVERSAGRAAIVYRRMSNPVGRDRLQRLTSLSLLAFTIATPLLREGIRCTATEQGAEMPTRQVELAIGPYNPLNADWGARVACFSIIAAGLRDADRLTRALGHLRNANSDEAAWWLGLLTREDTSRALRALRILVGAVD
jgi:hypothetical protein